MFDFSAMKSVCTEDTWSCSVEIIKFSIEELISSETKLPARQSILIKVSICHFMLGEYFSKLWQSCF